VVFENEFSFLESEREIGKIGEYASVFVISYSKLISGN